MYTRHFYYTASVPPWTDSCGAIDQMVYELYELTYEVMKIVEETHA